MTNSRLINAALWLFIIGAGLYLIEQLVSVTEILARPILMFAFAWLIALVVEPIFDWCSRLRIPRQWAIPLVYVLLVTIIIIGLVALIPVMYTQINSLILSLPTGLDLFWQYLDALQIQLKRIGFQSDIRTFFQIESVGTQLGSIGSTALQQSLELVSGVAQFTFEVIIILILSFYMASDRTRLFEGMVQLFPLGWRDEIHTFGNIISQTFGGYMRVQILISLTYAVVNAIVMALFGLSSITLVTAIISILVMIPVLGGVLALIPPVLVAAINVPDRIFAFVVVMLLVQQVLFNMIVPRMVGRIVGLHPLLVFAALLIGSVVAGAWGILFGIPLAGVVAAIVNYFYLRNQQVPVTWPSDEGLDDISP